MRFASPGSRPRRSRSTWLLVAALVAATAAGLPPASAGDDGSGRRTENVVLVTLDGLRWQEVVAGADSALMDEQAGGVHSPESLRARFWRDTPERRRRTLMPFLWEVIVPNGQLLGNAWRGSEVRVSNGRNFSYPGYSELLVGHPDDRIDSNDKIHNPNLNVLEWLNAQQGFAGRVAAFTAWDVFPFILNEPRSGVAVNSGLEAIEGSLTPRQELLNQLMRWGHSDAEGVRSDELTFFAALEHLALHRPRVLYISFDGTDANAHDRRYDRYLESAHLADRYLRLLWHTLQEIEGHAGRTALLVTTDHGRGGAPDAWPDHGADVEGAELIWLAAMGPDTPALGERDAGVHTQSQVAATLAALLGLDYATAQRRVAEPIGGLAGRR